MCITYHMLWTSPRCAVDTRATKRTARTSGKRLLAAGGGSGARPWGSASVSHSMTTSSCTVSIGRASGCSPRPPEAGHGQLQYVGGRPLHRGIQPLGELGLVPAVGLDDPAAAQHGVGLEVPLLALLSLPTNLVLSFTLLLSHLLLTRGHQAPFHELEPLRAYRAVSKRSALPSVL